VDGSHEVKHASIVEVTKNILTPIICTDHAEVLCKITSIFLP
jgi:hypothetical protein